MARSKPAAVITANNNVTTAGTAITTSKDYPKPGPSAVIIIVKE